MSGDERPRRSQVPLSGAAKRAHKLFRRLDDLYSRDNPQKRRLTQSTKRLVFPEGLMGVLVALLMGCAPLALGGAMLIAILSGKGRLVGGRDLGAWSHVSLVLLCLVFMGIGLTVLWLRFALARRDVVISIEFDLEKSTYSFQMGGAREVGPLSAIEKVVLDVNEGNPESSASFWLSVHAGEGRSSPEVFIGTASAASLIARDLAGFLEVSLEWRRAGLPGR